MDAPDDLRKAVEGKRAVETFLAASPVALEEDLTGC